MAGGGVRFRALIGVPRAVLPGAGCGAPTIPGGVAAGVFLALRVCLGGAFLVVRDLSAQAGVIRVQRLRLFSRGTSRSFELVLPLLEPALMRLLPTPLLQVPQELGVIVRAATALRLLNKPIRQGDRVRERQLKR